MNYMYEGRCNDITKQYIYVNTYTVGFLWVLPLIKSHLYLNLDKGRPSCSNIYALVHFLFYWQCIYITSTLSLKKNIANLSNKLAKWPITWTNTRRHKNDCKYYNTQKTKYHDHILAVSSIRNGKFNENIMNMIDKQNDNKYI